ncbi:unnamed protein product [Amoebophrya sp. A120]|nr:unnamed protein product [Amoebophrya sp. A120]|eukprot:GSA120T00023698001.1
MFSSPSHPSSASTSSHHCSTSSSTPSSPSRTRSRCNSSRQKTTKYEDAVGNSTQWSALRGRRRASKLQIQNEINEETRTLKNRRRRRRPNSKGKDTTTFAVVSSVATTMKVQVGRNSSRPTPKAVDHPSRFRRRRRRRPPGATTAHLQLFTRPTTKAAVLASCALVFKHSTFYFLATTSVTSYPRTTPGDTVLKAGPAIIGRKKHGSYPSSSSQGWGHEEEIKEERLWQEQISKMNSAQLPENLWADDADGVYEDLPSRSDIIDSELPPLTQEEEDDLIFRDNLDFADDPSLTEKTISLKIARRKPGEEVHRAGGTNANQVSYSEILHRRQQLKEYLQKGGVVVGGQEDHGSAINTEHDKQKKEKPTTGGHDHEAELHPHAEKDHEQEGVTSLEKLKAHVKSKDEEIRAGGGRGAQRMRSETNSDSVVTQSVKEPPDPSLVSKSAELETAKSTRAAEGEAASRLSSQKNHKHKIEAEEAQGESENVVETEAVLAAQEKARKKLNIKAGAGAGEYAFKHRQMCFDSEYPLRRVIEQSSGEHARNEGIAKCMQDSDNCAGFTVWEGSGGYHDWNAQLYRFWPVYNSCDPSYAFTDKCTCMTSLKYDSYINTKRPTTTTTSPPPLDFLVYTNATLNKPADVYWDEIEPMSFSEDEHLGGIDPVEGSYFLARKPDWRTEFRHLDMHAVPGLSLWYRPERPDFLWPKIDIDRIEVFFTALNINELSAHSHWGSEMFDSGAAFQIWTNTTDLSGPEFNRTTTHTFTFDSEDVNFTKRMKEMSVAKGDEHHQRYRFLVTRRTIRHMEADDVNYTEYFIDPSEAYDDESIPLNNDVIADGRPHLVQFYRDPVNRTKIHAMLDGYLMPWGKNLTLAPNDRWEKFGFMPCNNPEHDCRYGTPTIRIHTHMIPTLGYNPFLRPMQWKINNIVMRDPDLENLGTCEGEVNLAPEHDYYSCEGEGNELRASPFRTYALDGQSWVIDRSKIQYVQPSAINGTGFAIVLIGFSGMEYSFNTDHYDNNDSSVNGTFAISAFSSNVTHLPAGWETPRAGKPNNETDYSTSVHTLDVLVEYYNRGATVHMVLDEGEPWGEPCMGLSAAQIAAAPCIPILPPKERIRAIGFRPGRGQVLVPLGVPERIPGSLLSKRRGGSGAETSEEAQLSGKMFTPAIIDEPGPDGGTLPTENGVLSDGDKEKWHLTKPFVRKKTGAEVSVTLQQEKSQKIPGG